jgi:hypothetical protein
MLPLAELLADQHRCFGHRWSLPEHRQIELYTKRKKLAFGDAPPAGAVPAGTFGLLAAGMMLEAHLSSSDPLLMESRSSWHGYLALPRATVTDKLVAEVHRILRIFRIATFHRDGRIEASDGLVRASCNFNLCALALNITPAGLDLLGSFVHAFLDAPNHPYGEAYVERLLMQYFTDIVGEIHKFADEDRVLYQFRSPGYFNRHFRFDCDNPRLHADDDGYRFEIGAAYADANRYPIDFFVTLDDDIHIIPVEALKDGALKQSELSRWKAREPFRKQLPTAYQQRFGREVMVVGLPMT